MSDIRKTPLYLAIVCSGIFLLIVAASFLLSHRGNRPIIPVSPETTILTEPLKPNGEVDYCEYYDRLTRDDVTPDQNAAVAIVRACGPMLFREDEEAEKLRQLGIEPLSEEGNYFVPFKHWLRQNIPDSPLLEDDLEYRCMLAYAETRPWSDEELSDLSQWLEDISVPLDSIVQAGNRTHFFDSVYNEMDLLAANYPITGQIRPAFSAIVMSAMEDLHSEDFEAAINKSIMLIRLSKLIAKDPNPASKIDAFRVAEDACRCARQISRVPGCPVKELLRLRDAADSFSIDARILEGIEYERFVVLDSFNSFGRGGMDTFLELSEIGDSIRRRFLPILSRTADWRAAALEVNHWFDEAISATEKETYQQRSAAMDESRTQLLAAYEETDARKLKYDRRIQGEHIAQTFVLYYRLHCVLHIAETRLEAERRLTVLAIALEIYHREHGTYPVSLPMLMPDYVSNIPVDPFGEGQFPYSGGKQQYRLYSIARNLKDYGGISELAESDLPVVLHNESTLDDFRQEFLRRELTDAQ